MIQNLDYPVFSEFVNASEEISLRFQGESYNAYLRMSIMHWGKRLGAKKTALMNFIADRTLRYGRAAALVYFDQFRNGVTRKDGYVVSSGTGLSNTTIRKYLRELCEEGFLDIYTCQTGKVENMARLYALNVDQLQIWKAASMSILREPKQRAAREKFNGNSRIDTPPPELEGLKKEETYKPQNLTADRRAVARTTVEEVIARATAKSATAQIKRIAKESKKTEPGRLTMVALQALLDEKMKLYCPSLPRVVVGMEPFGVLRKRIEAYGITDVPRYIDWIVRSWSDIANRQRRQSLKMVVENRVSYTLLSMSPNMNDLAYKFPYFVKLYGSFCAERPTNAAPDQALKDENARLKKALVVTNDKVRAAEQARMPVRAVVRQPMRSVVQADSDFPSWEG